MTKWEYQTEYILGLQQDRLNQLGNEGWELAGVKDCYYFFKRPLPKNSKKATITHDEENFVESVVKILNAALSSNFKAETKATRDCILARKREGFNLSEFESVIVSRKDAWKDDENMKQYLRPETLFGNKFEGYLNVAKIKTEEKKPKIYY